jgi:hypothetical protein
MGFFNALGALAPLAPAQAEATDIRRQRAAEIEKNQLEAQEKRAQIQEAQQRVRAGNQAMPFGPLYKDKVTGKMMQPAIGPNGLTAIPAPWGQTPEEEKNQQDWEYNRLTKAWQETHPNEQISPEINAAIFANAYGLNSIRPTASTSDTRQREDYEEYKKTHPAYTDSFEKWQADQKRAPKMDAYNEWLKDPATYEKFASMAAKYKGGSAKGGMMTPYAAVGLYRLALTSNPELLPMIAPLLSSVFGKVAKLPEGAEQVFGTIPLDQPLSPTTNQPIGTHMPSAPTGSTRTQAQIAQRVLAEIPTIRQSVNDAATLLGPANGRLLIGFLLGTVGSTGNDQIDRQLNSLRTTLMFAGSASAKFHVNSVQAMNDFEALANSGKNTAPAINGFLDSVEEWARTAASQQLGYGERQGGATPPSLGSQPNAPNKDPLGLFSQQR